MNPADLGPAWLFCPADRPDRFGKAAAAADVVILDLEDGVAPADRARARGSLQTELLDPDRTVVRVNPVGTDDHALDLAALGSTRYETLMLAKTESEQQVSGLDSYRVVALCETARGVLAAAEIAAARNTVAVMWGAEDLIASLGGRSARFPGGGYREVARQARSAVLLAAGAYRRFALDAVHVNIPDLEGLRVEAEDAAASGFSATVCIHPTQLPVVRAAYRPAEAELAWARRVLAAARSAPGVFALEGRMVDEPVLRQARRMVERAG